MTFSEMISSGQLVLIDFYATWCEPCKWVEPVLDEVVKNFSGKILLHKIDIDQQPEVAREQHILSVPSLLLFKNGKEVWRMRGFDTAPALTKIFESYR
jgi:thioredoxin 1